MKGGSGERSANPDFGAPLLISLMMKEEKNLSLNTQDAGCHLVLHFLHSRRYDALFYFHPPGKQTLHVGQGDSEVDRNLIRLD